MGEGSLGGRANLNTFIRAFWIRTLFVIRMELAVFQKYEHKISIEQRENSVRYRKPSMDNSVVVEYVENWPSNVLSAFPIDDVDRSIIKIPTNFYRTTTQTNLSSLFYDFPIVSENEIPQYSSPGAILERVVRNPLTGRGIWHGELKLVSSGPHRIRATVFTSAGAPKTVKRDNSRSRRPTLRVLT